MIITQKVKIKKKKIMIFFIHLFFNVFFNYFFFQLQIAYAVFLAVYTYACLVKTPKLPDGPEIYVTLCMANFFCEKVRTLVATEPHGLLHKMQVWHNDTYWNIFDSLAIIMYLAAFTMRLSDPQFLPYARVVYATDICYWYIRVLRLIGNHLQL